MKIDIISHIYPTKTDPSSGIFIQKEAQIIASRHQVELFIPTVLSLPFQNQFYRSKDPVKETFSVSNVKYLSIPKRKWPKFTTRNLSQSLIKRLISSRADIIHLHWLFPAGLTTPVLKRLKKPIVLTLHGGDWYSNQNRKMDDLQKEALINCDAVVCVGNQLKKDIEKKYPFLTTKLHHIPHGIDINRFKPQQSATSFRHLNWDFSTLNLLSVANLYPVKGIDILIEAFESVSKLTNAHLHIVAPRRDREYSNQVFKLIAKKELKNKITFYPSMTEQEIIPFYQAADLFISSSKKEGFGLAVAEAIACGTPVITTKSGGPEEIVNQKVGRQVTNNDVNELASGINSVLKNLTEYKKENLHNYIKEYFSSSKKLNSLLEIYHLLKNKS